MSLEALDELRQQDWGSIFPRLIRAAIVIAARYGWSPDRVLPKGGTIDDLVSATVREMFEQPQRRRSDVPLLTQLIGIVRQKLWNLSQSKDAEVCRPGDLDPMEHRPQHEERCDDGDEFQRAITLLLEVPKVKENPDMNLMVTAIGTGFFDPPEVARETGLPIERVYQLRRELNDIYPRIAAQLNEKGGKS